MPSKGSQTRVKHCDGKRGNPPKASDLTGSDPDFTGKLTTDEYIREVRGEDVQSKLSDAEIVCSFMEPKPTTEPRSALEMELCGSPKRSRGGFWVCRCFDEDGDMPTWYPIRLTLNELHLVEERLTDEQWGKYVREMGDVPFYGVVNDFHRILLNATAEQKIAALAEVLRSEVEK